ncbi:Spy0128 family protein [Pseudoramibacter sp. HA2172]|uniref:Spy0128 family protein n=1 Tax=Pseudoramibacter faecis TaxID=3108534 RepID=UPI002E790D24|nr:FctA domain-containing protein [Pseudoramibacter sp. HA2172]
MRIKKLIGCAWLLPLVLAAALALPAPARAAMIEGVRPDPLNISVTTKTLKGSKTAPTGQKYRVTVTSQQSAYPVNRSFTFTDAGTQALIWPTYDAPGTYRYAVAMQPEKTADHFTYDTRIYTVTVFVRNAKSGSRLEAVIVLNDNDPTAAKPTALTFENTYYLKASEPVIPVTPMIKKVRTGDSSRAAIYLATLLGAAALWFAAGLKRRGSGEWKAGDGR